MRAPTPIADLKLVGGALPVDFVNTVGSWAAGDFRDALVGVEELFAWVRRVALVEPSEERALRAVVVADPAAGTRLLREARALRATLHAIFSAYARGVPPPDDASDALAAAAERAQRHRRLHHAEAGFMWQWSNPHELATVLDRIALAAADLLVSRDRKPFKECPAHECGWVFLDTSRNGKRRWCSEEDCGTQHRVRAFRERQKG